MLVLKVCNADCPMGVDVHISVPVVFCVFQDDVGGVCFAVPMGRRKMILLLVRGHSSSPSFSV